MGKRLAAVGVAAAIAGGGLTVAAVNPLSVAGAASASTPATTSAAPAAKVEGPLKQALKTLVADHTLTQAQADQVLATTKADAKADRAKHKATRKANRQELVALVAKAIGETPQQLVAGLRDGTSIAKQAEAKGVSRQAVSDVITKALDARIDAAAKAGKIKPARAARLKGRVPAAVTRILDADGHRLRGN